MNKKVIIAGSRYFNNYHLLKITLDDLFKEEKIEVVSGGANGADALGERYAKEKGYLIHRFPAEWDKYGKAAGPIRNRKMAEFANYAVIFWDGKSRGSKNMIDSAKNLGLTVKVIIF